MSRKKNNSGFINCKSCRGTGVRYGKSLDFFGASVCTSCNGSGKSKKVTPELLKGGENGLR